DSHRLLDGRRSRRQPERDCGGDARGAVPGALDGGRSLPARYRGTDCRPVDAGRVTTAGGADRPEPRAVSRAVAPAAQSLAQYPRAHGGATGTTRAARRRLEPE